MVIILSISLVIFIVLSITLLVLYLKQKNKFSLLTNNLADIKNDLSKRIGFYTETMNLLSKEDKKNGIPGESYTTVIHVKELDRYANGMSKIKITDVELISGFDTNQHEWVKQFMRMKFTSVKKTTDIEWLESEDSIKDIRKQKLKKLDDLLKK